MIIAYLKTLLLQLQKNISTYMNNSEHKNTPNNHLV